MSEDDYDNILVDDLATLDLNWDEVPALAAPYNEADSEGLSWHLSNEETPQTQWSIRESWGHNWNDGDYNEADSEETPQLQWSIRESWRPDWNDGEPSRPFPLLNRLLAADRYKSITNRSRWRVLCACRMYG